MANLPDGLVLIFKKRSNVEGWSVILCLNVNGNEYVTWNYHDASGERQSGHYFPGTNNATRIAATKDFDSRN